MKLATLNINNVRRRLPNLLAWLSAAQPDVVCLQELKTTDAEFPVAEINRAGYHAAWRGQKTWNGVAILGRARVPVVTRTQLPGDPDDTQSRYIEAAVDGIVIGCVYLPNGNPQPGPKFDYKLAWFDRLARHATALSDARVPVALLGDFNVVPTEADIYPTHSWDDDALLQPESRAAFRQLLKQGWTDAVRTLHPDAPMYTYWDYKRRRWERDAGLRLDFILLGPDLAPRLVDAGVDRAVRGEPNASDHAPVWAVLRDAEGAMRFATATKPRPAKTTARTAAKAAAKPAAPRPARSEAAERAALDRPLLVIDGDSFAHRFYHALPKTVLRKGRKGAGAITGFANLLLRLYREERPRAVVIGWDTLTVPTYRHKLFPAYQSGRHFDHALVEQLDVLPEFVTACGFVSGKAPGYEADDFLAAAVARAARRGAVLVASGDRDTFQLVSERTTVLFPAGGGVIHRIGPAEVRARYGVDPAQVPDFIALRGDPSDKLPGARGVGAKGAADVLRRHDTLEAVLQAGRFVADAKALRLYRHIATMDASAPLPPVRNRRPTWGKAAALARAWELDALATRLEQAAEDRYPGDDSA